MKWKIPLLLLSPLLLFAIPAPTIIGQGRDEVPLKLQGDTTVVQVDQIIVVKVPRTVVKSFPIQIIAPEGIGFYFWTCPIGVKFVDKGNVLQIDYAPKGETTISLKLNSYDKATDRYVTKFSDIIFSVGEIPGPVVPPKPPIDPVDPVIPPNDPLVGIIQAAYTADADPNKAANTASLAGLYNVSAVKAYDTNIKTTGELWTLMKQASFNLKLTDKILTVRGTIATELNKILPLDPNVPLTTDPAKAPTDPTRKLLSDTYKRVEAALGACK